MIQAVIKNMKKFQADIKREDQRTYKNSITATKIEGYRLKNVLSEEIIAGRPGGQAFKAMRKISQLSRQYQAMYGSKLWRRTKIPAPQMGDPPLRSLAISGNVRYKFVRQEEQFSAKVGFLKKRSGKSTWQRIAQRQQEGFTIPLTDKLREAFATWPKKMASAGKASKGIYFPKEKTHLVVPPRNVIEPFWRKYQRKAYENIKRNFEAKMAGKRV